MVGAALAKGRVRAVPGVEAELVVALGHGQLHGGRHARSQLGVVLRAERRISSSVGVLKQLPTVRKSYPYLSRETPSKEASIASEKKPLRIELDAGELVWMEITRRQRWADCCSVSPSQKRPCPQGSTILSLIAIAASVISVRGNQTLASRMECR